MNFTELRKFMKEVRFGLFATSDGKKVGVRPLAAWAWVDKELWCGAEKGQEKISQLSKVPFAEYCFIRPDGEHVRIAGPCKVSTSLEDKTKLFNLVLSLHKFYDTPKDKAYIVLRMRPTKIRWMDRATYAYHDVKSK
ncbi:MAG: pyridoxamine 5'-phosphate oxidase family protein [Candidatus Omnitrophota bacterium]|jgi:uncharacterized pyridoxamine 5'-phosphate oxidase family protein